MFWTKKQRPTAAVSTELGTFVWDQDYAGWVCELGAAETQLVLWYHGNPFQTAHVVRFRQILADSERLSKLALESNVAQIKEYDHTPDEMRLISCTIDPASDEEDCSLSFQFLKWPDGGLEVHFKNGRIVDSHIDD